MISDDDIHDVVEELGPDDFWKLYVTLGLCLKEIKKCEASAATNDVDQKAMHVLQYLCKT